MGEFVTVRDQSRKLLKTNKNINFETLETSCSNRTITVFYNCTVPVQESSYNKSWYSGDPLSRGSLSRGFGLAAVE